MYILYICIYIDIYMYQFESHLTMCWIKRKEFENTYIL